MLLVQAAVEGNWIAEGEGCVIKQDELRNVLTLIEIIHGNLVPSGRLKLRREVHVWCERNETGCMWKSERSHSVELYWRIQLVPRRKRYVSVTQTSQLMLYREIIAVCSEIHTKHINTLCGQKVESVDVILAVHIMTTGL
jgi:hypothetical protein